jgi:hypothetical protein
MADVASALQKLATYRTQNNRASQETFDRGVIVLKSDVAKTMGEEGACVAKTSNPSDCLTAFVGWAFLEQLALAAIDVGRTDVADVCIVLPVPSCGLGTLTSEVLAMFATSLGQVPRFSAG